MNATHDAARRRFLQVLGATGGALIVGLPLHVRADTPDELLGEQLIPLDPYVRIERDGTVVIGARDPETGQGIRTAEARIIADEMDADWPRVRVVSLPLGVGNDNGEPRWTLGHQEARGSTGVPAAWSDLRAVGAAARALLIEAAAQRWNVAAHTLRGERGVVIAGDGRRLEYGALAADAALLPAPSPPPAPKTPAQYRLIGQDAGDVDARDIVTGAQQYAIDTWFGDALVAIVTHCPYPGGALARLDASQARSLKGVEQVLVLPQPDAQQPLGTRPLAASVAVLAKDTWTALQGAAALHVEWQRGAHVAQDDDALAVLAANAFTGAPTQRVRRDGDIDHARKLAHRTIEAEYRVATVAHAELEPPNALVRIDADRAVVVAPVQNPREALRVVQRLTGLAPSQIEVRLPRTGGGFGRFLENDHVAEAVLLAKAARKPVKLLWTREQAFAHDTYRPFALQRLAATLDRHGKFTGWSHRLASTSRLAGREARDREWLSEMHPDDLPAGLIANLEYDWFALPSQLPRGNFRSGAHGVNAFAVQVFLDEIAHATRRDALQLRLDLLGKPQPLPYRGHGGPALDTGRLANVLLLAADAIGWKKPRNDGHGLGLAFHFTFGGYVAHAMEVSVTGGRLTIHRVVVAADLGRVVNPLGARAALAGATLDGISTALDLAITLQDGRVAQRGFRDYPLAGFAQLPREVQTILVPAQDDPGGAYDMGFPGAAPALANAIFAATTVRVRALPILPELMRLL